MATATLTPGSVVLLGSPSPHVDSVVVGAPPQWADGSDATYATVHRKAHATEPWTGSDHATAPLDVFAATSVTAIAVNIRASSSTGGTVTIGPWLYSTAGGPSSSPFAAMAQETLVADGSIQTVAGSFEDDDEDPESNSLLQAAAALAAGATLAMRISTPFGTDLTIYEVSIVVTYDDETPATRLYPRKDAHGPMGSAPRLVGEWPPERLIRY